MQRQEETQCRVELVFLTWSKSFCYVVWTSFEYSRIIPLFVQLCDSFDRPRLWQRQKFYLQCQQRALFPIWQKFFDSQCNVDSKGKCIMFCTFRTLCNQKLITCVLAGKETIELKVNVSNWVWRNALLHTLQFKVFSCASVCSLWEIYSQRFCSFWMNETLFTPFEVWVYVHAQYRENIA